MPPPPPKSPDHDSPDRSDKSNKPDKPLVDSPQQKAGDFVERDLWELDDEWDADEAPPATAAPSNHHEPQAPTQPDELDDETPMVLEPMPLNEPEFDHPPLAESARSVTGEAATHREVESGESPAQNVASSSSTPPVDPTPEPDDETQPTAKEAAPAPRRRAMLSKFELISLTAVLALLVGAGSWFFKTFFEEIPTRRMYIEMPDFPVTGDRAKIDSAATFWRKPIREGENRDAAGGDVKLIPVLELTLESGDNGALRVFFHDGDDELIGDSLTRTFAAGSFATSSGNTTQIAATAGFDDEGLHAAYQASQSDLWMVEVFEGPSKDATFDEFKLLFKMPISTDLR